MSKSDSPAVLVARFLRNNNYNETLDVFLNEAGLPPDTGSTSAGSLTIEKILEEKKVFDIARDFEKVGFDDGNKSWTLPAPCTSSAIQTLRESSNLLHVSLENISEAGSKQRLLLATSADRKLSILQPTPPYSLSDLSLPLFDSPVLSCCVIDSQHLLTSSMSGRVLLTHLATGRVVSERTDHTKYVVKLASWQDATGFWVATAAWDAKIFLYHMPLPSMTTEAASSTLALGDPIGTLTLGTNPESIIFVPHPELTTPVLLVGRRDSTFLYYYGMPTTSQPGDTSPPPLLPLLGQQNLAPHSNAWISFSPSAFALSPLDPSVLAVATSATPHMKLIIARLLLPPPPLANGMPAVPDQPTYTTQTGQARASLALQDREAAAIMVHCSTMAPQTAYSTPGLAWRPDGSGVWVNGDDGVIRGVEAATGKIVAHLKGGHEAGAKIRCLWAGRLRDSDGEKNQELLISGGFDRRLIVWSSADAAT